MTQPGPKPKPWQERLEAKIDRSAGPGLCHLWTGAVAKNGYGMFGVAAGKTVCAHRAAWESEHGPIPDGLTVDHVKDRGCTSRLCCNTEHMELVTRAVNTMRGESPPAQNARKTRCGRGHVYAVHGYVRPNGWRCCRLCETDQQRIRRRIARGSEPES